MREELGRVRCEALVLLLLGALSNAKALGTRLASKLAGETDMPEVELPP